MKIVAVLFISGEERGERSCSFRRVIGLGLRPPLLNLASDRRTVLGLSFPQIWSERGRTTRTSKVVAVQASRICEDGVSAMVDGVSRWSAKIVFLVSPWSTVCERRVNDGRREGEERGCFVSTDLKWRVEQERGWKGEESEDWGENGCERGFENLKENNKP